MKDMGHDFTVLVNHPIKPGEEAKYPNYDDYRHILMEAYISEKTAICQNMLSADLVIFGLADEKLIAERLKRGGMTFRYAERFYKNGIPLKHWIRDWATAWLHHGRFQKYPIYLLCASAYTAADAYRFGNYKDRCYRWGYFPAVRQYELPKLMESKEHRKPVLLWAGRLIDWKHPEDAIAVAEKLKRAGYAFELKLIGSGSMEQQLRQMIEEKGLSDCVLMPGSMKPEEVRAHMEQANVYLFTSDRGEGWGAVLNESMNSGCAVVASHAIGAVPFLIKDGENGRIYRSGDVDILYEKVKALLDDPAEQKRLGEAAYRTIAEVWNAQVAAERLLVLADCIKNGKEVPFTDGPCSKAPILREDWYGE